MSRPYPVILALALAAGRAASIADEPPRLVGEFGGRTVSGNDILVLDVAPPAIRRIDRRTLSVRTTPLLAGDTTVAPYGIAADREGTVWALSDKGRTLVRFSADTGERLTKRGLREPGQGVTALGDRIGVVAIRLRAGEPLLLAARGDGLAPFSSILSRTGVGPAAHLIANLLRCGSGFDTVPCWFLAGPPEVLLVHGDGSVTRTSVPSFARAASRRSYRREPGSEFVYPVRDAFLGAEGLWILSNQEGDRTPLEKGAVRGRHVTLVREGRPVRNVALHREARAILDAESSRLMILYADGGMGAVAVP